MNKPATFDRRGRDSAAAAPAQGLATKIELTPEQRAYLFRVETLPDAREPPTETATRHNRQAGLIACLAVTALVSALTLFGKSHDTIAALPPQLEEQAKIVFAPAGDWFAPLSLAWSIFVIGSNLAANIWLTQKICAWRNWSDLRAFSLVGAVLSVAIAFVAALVGLGETEIGYALEALSGGGAAALYRLIAGRRF